MKKLFLSMAMIASVATAFAQKTLVIYYSENGTTKTVAEEIQKQLGADLEAVEAVEPYTGDFGATMQRGNKERQSGQWPAIKPLKKKIADYDVIFLGYPIWYGTLANPMDTLVKAEDFAGKTIVPFCTFGSGGLNTSTADLEKALPKAKVMKGYGVRAARVTKAAKELNRFLIENGYKKGSVEKLADFSEQKPVTEADKKLFDEACSSYQMPLGTPKTVGKRATADGTDYKFGVVSRGMDGKEASSTIYVTVEKGGKPEFTEVVR